MDPTCYVRESQSLALSTGISSKLPSLSRWFQPVACLMRISCMDPTCCVQESQSLSDLTGVSSRAPFSFQVSRSLVRISSMDPICNFLVILSKFNHGYESSLDTTFSISRPLVGPTCGLRQPPTWYATYLRTHTSLFLERNQSRSIMYVFLSWGATAATTTTRQAPDVVPDVVVVR